MEPNNEQGIQLEYLSNLDIQQTNEWLDSVTVEQIMGLMNEPFDGEIYSKLLNLPAIEAVSYTHLTLPTTSRV